MESYKKEIYGSIEYAATRLRFMIIAVSLMYVVIAIVAIIYTMNYGSLLYVPCAILVAFVLWRINAMHRPVILACSKALLLAVPLGSVSGVNSFSSIFKAKYLPVPYSSIVGFSDDWSILYLGEVDEGGLVKIPVLAKYISAKSKRIITKIIEDKQQNAEWKSKKNEEE